MGASDNQKVGAIQGFTDGFELVKQGAKKFVQTNLGINGNNTATIKAKKTISPFEQQILTAGLNGSNRSQSA